MARIAVIGAGAWGTALAIALGRGGSHQLKLWAYEKEVVESIRATHVNEPFLSGCPLPESIEATQSLAEAIAGAEIVLSVMPSHHARRVWSQMKPLLHPEMLLVSATKGIENESLLRMTQVITDVLTHGEGSFPPRLCAHQRTHLCARGRQGLSHRPQRGLRRSRALRAGAGSLQRRQLPPLPQR